MGENIKVLVTGAAGFIGFHLCKRLLSENIETIGIDSINDYYDVNLKKSRLINLKELAHKTGTNFSFYGEDISDKKVLFEILKKSNINIIYNLAAQAGVRYSIENPSAYINSNLVGFGNILEAARQFKIEQLIYASSSSVYGGNSNIPFKENQPTSHQVSLYGATKKCNEVMAHSYSHLYNLSATGLRFFTVYGPWGRPDMALFLFTKSILEEQPINIFNNGKMIRDFTFIDDIVESLFRLKDRPAKSDPNFNSKDPDPSQSWAPHKVFNIGNSEPVELMDYISALEKSLGKKSIKNFMPMQDGDVPITASDCSKLENWIDFRPKTKIKVGIQKFVDWYLDYYKIKT